MGNDVADRIKQQTYENIQKRLRDQIAEREQVIAELNEKRKKDAEQHESELEGVLLLVDTLLDFITQNCGDIPETLLDIIARRQEERILRSLPPAPEGNPAASDGQVMKMGPDGKVSWVPLSRQ